MSAAAIPLLKTIWRVRPSAILSNMAHMNFLALVLKLFYPHGTRVIVRQNGTASAMLETGQQAGWMHWLYRVLYPLADCVICQTRSMARDLERIVPGISGRVAVLANPVDAKVVERTAAPPEPLWTGPGPHLLAVGRLSHEKGFDLLLHALAIVREEFPHASLAVAGMGREETALRKMSEFLGLGGSVQLLGALPQPAVCFAGATAFVLSSRHEGLPNALLEAGLAGLPIISTPASEGVVELLQGQEGVWLSTEVSAEALADRLRAALQKIGPGQRFAHRWAERFRLEAAIPAYEALIDSLLEAPAL